MCHLSFIGKFILVLPITRTTISLFRELWISEHFPIAPESHRNLRGDYIWGRRYLKVKLGGCFTMKVGRRQTFFLHHGQLPIIMASSHSRHAIFHALRITFPASRKRITSFSIGLSQDRSFFILPRGSEGFLFVPEFAILWTGEVR